MASGGDQSLYANLLARTQQESARALPSANYQANYTFDPILARLSALSQMTIANARDEAVSLRKRALIESGDATLAGELAADDPNTIEAARKNEFGTRQLLNRDYMDRLRQGDEALNNANLYYGGARVDELARQQFGMREAENSWLSRFRELFSGIGEELLRSEEAENQRIIDAAIASGGRVPIASPFSGGGGPTAPVTTTPIPTTDVSWQGPQLTIQDLIDAGGWIDPYDQDIVDALATAAPLG